MASLPPRRPSGSGKVSPKPRPRTTAKVDPPNRLGPVLIIAVCCVGVLIVGAFIMMGLLFPAARQAAEGQLSDAATTDGATTDVEAAKVAKKRLRQIGLAAFNFHDTWSQFPPLLPRLGQDGAWQVPASFHTSLLPFVDQEPLFQRVDKTQPWDAPANAAVFQTAVPEFLHPAQSAAAVQGGYAPTHWVVNSRLQDENGKGLALRNITDGSSNTVLTGQIDAAFPAWGDPQATRRDPANGFGGGPTAFGGGGTDGPFVLLADGSARRVSPNIDPAIAKALATPGGGEPIRVEF